MKKKVLITGASGFVGYHLISEALAANLEVYAAVRPGSNLKHLEGLPVHYIHLDYISVEKLRSSLNEIGIDYIVHAAGTTKAKTESDYNKINAGYTKHLAIAASTLDKPLEKFVFVSSLAALGPQKNLGSQIENHTVAQPVTSYGKSKLLAEAKLKKIQGLPLLVFRPTAVYGPREKDIFILFNSINKGLEPHIGRFPQQLSFIYVTDLAKLIISSLQSGVINKSYNVTDGEVYDRYALANLAKEILQKRTLKFHLPVAVVSALASLLDKIYAKSSNTPALNREKMAELTAVNWACNINELKKDLNFKPSFNLERGLLETLTWYKANKWL